MTLTSHQIRLRIAGGFDSAQVSREETKEFDKRAQKTLQANEDIVALEHEYFEHIAGEVADTASYLVEKIGLLMKLGEHARKISDDYARMIERHETLCKAYHQALQNRRLPVSLRQDIADAHEQHTGLLKDLIGGKAMEDETYLLAQILLKKFEPRLMVSYQNAGFPVFEMLDAMMHEEDIAEEYGEGRITLDEALAMSVENDTWKPTMQ